MHLVWIWLLPQGLTSQPLSLAGYLLLLLAAAQLSYQLLEQPIRQHFARRSPAEPIAALPSGG